MGEELLNNKLYFEDKNGEMQEINYIKNIDLQVSDNKDEELKEYMKDLQRAKSWRTTINLSKMSKKDKLEIDSIMRRWRKYCQSNHVSFKRAKKILMARGLGRNESNELLKHMRKDGIPRTEYNIRNVKMIILKGGNHKSEQLYKKN